MSDSTATSDPPEWSKAYNNVEFAIKSTQACLDAKPDLVTEEWTASLKKQTIDLNTNIRKLGIVQREGRNPDTKTRSDNIKVEATNLFDRARMEVDGPGGE